MENGLKERYRLTILAQLDVAYRFIVLFTGQKGIKVVRVEEAITTRNEVKEFMKCLCSLTDHLRFEIADEYFLWEHKIAKDGRVE